jgi:hypothetical protein
MSGKLTPQQAMLKTIQEKRASTTDELRADVAQEAIAPDMPDPALSVEVNIPLEERPPLTLAERLFGRKAEPEKKSAPPKKRIRGKKKDNFLTEVLPTLLTGFIVTFAHDLVADPYKPCVPTSAEVDAILAPFFNYWSRRIDIDAEVSEDAIDIGKCLFASITCGARIYITYKQIRQEEEERNTRRARAYGDASTQAARDDTAAGARNPGPGSAGARAKQAAPQNHDDGHSDDQVGLPNNGGGEAGTIAELFERDKRGRVRLGLLPGDVPDAHGAGDQWTYGSG